MNAVMITGVNGFVGASLAAEMAAQGRRVWGTTSTPAGVSAPTPGVERHALLRFGDPIPQEMFSGVDLVIHCAYDLRPAHMQDNVSGTKKIAEVAAAAGVGRQIFISSYSAHAAAANEYGKTKFILQQHFLAQGQTVVRPGLIIGPGGMFKRIFQTMQRYHVAPLIGGGGVKMPIVALADFLTALAALAESRRAGIFNLFLPQLVTLREFAAAVRAASGRKTLLVPVPAGLLRASFGLIGKLGMALPVDADSLKGLAANQELRDRSDLTQFVPNPLTLEEMVAAASLAMSTAGVPPRGASVRTER
jgi:nucleoside-diphosphate-sugar epimerase